VIDPPEAGITTIIDGDWMPSALKIPLAVH
jgi:hypothetical protein